jgi:AcrR family transcriptional regulator
LDNVYQGVEHGTGRRQSLPSRTGREQSHAETCHQTGAPRRAEHSLPSAGALRHGTRTAQPRERDGDDLRSSDTRSAVAIAARAMSAPGATRADGASLATESSRSARNGRSRHLDELQRRRILAAMARVTSEDGLQAVTIARIIEDAKVARRRFYELFDDREDCFLATFDEAVATAEQRVRARVEEPAPWVDRIRNGLRALLELCDEEPELAKVCVVHASAGGRSVLSRRREVLLDLIRLVDGGRVVRRSATELSSLTAEGVVGAVFAVIHDRLLAPERTRLTTLLSPLMAIVVLPYEGAGAAQRELSRAAELSRRRATKRSQKAHDPLEGLQMRMTYRTICVLSAIHGSPAASNREIADVAGIKDQGQTSKLLARLEGLGLLRNAGPGQAEGGPNAWELTARGTALTRSLGMAAGSSQTPAS